MAPEEGLESPDLPEGAGEFLDSWLMLLEKMVNVKTMLETPHTLPAKHPGLLTRVGESKIELVDKQANL